MSDDELVLRFDPQTIDHLGAKMYSHLPNAIAELIANAYDADASNVTIQLDGTDSITIADDGHGMSRSDVRDKYLHIGRNRRLEYSNLTESGLRRVSGKKGLGKLALFGIGRSVELSTTRTGSDERTIVSLDYEEMRAAKGDYRPVESSDQVGTGAHGTTVRLEHLKRTTPVVAEDLAKSLARLFNYVDAEFRVEVVAEDGQRFAVTSGLRLDAVSAQFTWDFPADGGEENTFLRDHGVTGRIISTARPIPQSYRGITLYINGRQANEPEFFDASTSSHAYSYLSGYLMVDYLDALEPDVIATDRRSLDWGRDETAELRDALTDFATWLATDWRRQRSASARAETERRLGEPTQRWIESIRTSEAAVVRDIVTTVEQEEALSAEQQVEILRLVKTAIPENAEYAWRHLHPSIQDATRERYLSADFYGAVAEAIKRYVNSAKRIASVTDDEAMRIVSGAFGEKGKLQVFSPYASLFHETTARNIEEGQKHISMGIVAGFRNPMAHEEIAKLHKAGAFTFDDCLDALSIISHLMRRLDDASASSD
jgi:uncharacterized protein (TIGR02391 family)